MTSCILHLGKSLIKTKTGQIRIIATFTMLVHFNITFTSFVMLSTLSINCTCVRVLVGIRVLDGPLTDSMEAVAFNKHYQVNDVYSCRSEEFVL